MYATATVTAAGLAILDDPNAGAQRTTLGLGTGDSPSFTGLTLSGVLSAPGLQTDAGGVISSSSDANLKKNISTLDNALNSALELRGVTYNWKDETKPQSKQLGVIAQEIEAIFPELVTVTSDGFKAVNYIGLIPVLIEAIKEQQKLIEKLMADLSNEKTTKEEMKAALDKQMKLSDMQMKLMAQMQMENSSMKSDIELIKEQMGIKSTKTND